MHIQHSLPPHSSHLSTFPCDSSKSSYIHSVIFTTTFLFFTQFTPKTSCLSFALCFAIQNKLQTSRLISTFSRLDSLDLWSTAAATTLNNLFCLTDLTSIVLHRNHPNIICSALITTVNKYVINNCFCTTCFVCYKMVVVFYKKRTQSEHNLVQRFIKLIRVSVWPSNLWVTWDHLSYHWIF